MATLTKTKTKTKTGLPFAGNGLSRTAMVFKIATLGGVKLTAPMLNKIKDVNPRSLERVYDEVLRQATKATRFLP